MPRRCCHPTPLIASLVIIVEVPNMQGIEVPVLVNISSKIKPRKQPRMRNKIWDNNIF
jgi:hypothetical protein